MKKLKFPEGFYWGSATASEQIEHDGYNEKVPKTIWTQWYKENKWRFFDKNFTMNNFFENYKEDLDIAQDLSFNSMRISFNWARLIPEHGKVSQNGINFYKDLFKQMKIRGIKVFATINHFDIPLWVQNDGPLHTKKFLIFYEELYKLLFDNFDDDVDIWATFNESIIYVGGQYWYDDFYPNYINFKNSIKAIWILNLGHHKAVFEHKKRNMKSEIGAIHNITPYISRSNSESDLKATRIAEQIQWKSFLDPIHTGEFPKELENYLKEKGLWPEDFITNEEREFIKNTSGGDYLGINYYKPARAKSLDYIPDWNNGVTPSTHFYNNYEPPNRRMNIHRGWEIRPESIYSLLNTIKNDYGNMKTYITENGMGVQGESMFRDKNGQIQDDYRIEFIKEHLYWLHKSIEEGANCWGYHMWTYIDNWSWSNAYKNRYGFVELDLKTGKRIYKKSASWAREVYSTGILEIDEDY